MKRRQAIRSIFGLPAIVALPAGAQEKPAELKPAPVEETPKLATVMAESVAVSEKRFFSDTQLGTMRKLSALLMPPVSGKPGAEEAQVAEFLDFLIGHSPAGRQALYREGLDTLEAGARRQYSRPFAELGESEAAELLAPLLDAWTHAPPASVLARFLRATKDDVFRATVNSRQWAAAATGRRGAGTGSYWLAME